MKTLMACLFFSLLMPCTHAADTIADLTTLAETGDAGAQYALGQKYQNGDGVTKDISVAVQWYGKASDLGSIDARLRLGLFYKNGHGVDKDAKRGFELIKSVAELGHPFAQLVVGTMYLDGIGVDSNIASGIQWITTSAEQGDYLAQLSLSEIYMLGRYDQARDRQKSLYWLTQNANNPGNPGFENDYAKSLN